ncbi:MAG: RagB/SusD family nutrient uptake outer membrane protein [Balneolaceae bacterium]|nr:RagB/SusD family nutrient uptake outer membrane protein [Balneolaceae bacterium]
MNIKILIPISVLLIAGLVACDIFSPIDDPNRPSAEGLTNNATRGQLQSVVIGLEARHRQHTVARSSYTTMFGAFGRELYYFNESDPSFGAEWLQLPGSSTAEQNNNFFVSVSSYQIPYQAINHGRLLISSAENSSEINQQERSAYNGLARTIMGYQFLIPLNRQFEDGIRTDVANPLSPGPFRTYSEAVSDIRAILDQGATDLAGAGSSLPFTLSGGFDGFQSPQGLRQINRAIAARAAIYAEDWQGALDALSESFLELTPGEASMNRGGYHLFPGGDDPFNNMFFSADAATNDLIVVHPGVIEDAEPNDLRVERKFTQRASPISSSIVPGVQVQFQDGRFDSNTDPKPFIRNEELILIYAEANAQLNNLGDAVDAINIVRNTWNLPDFNSNDQQEIIDQILFERRYSLWGEGGHRWIDMRRYDRLDEIDTSLDGGRVPLFLGRPIAEIDWDNFF